MKWALASLLIVAATAQASDNRKLLCHATNIYFEARGEPLIGQLAVRDVVDNRGEDTCKIVFACKQFSWTLSESRKRVQAFLQDRPALTKPEDRKAWELAKFVAGTPIRVLPAQYKHFYNPSKAKPAWRAKGQRLGKHVFVHSVAMGDPTKKC